MIHVHQDPVTFQGRKYCATCPEIVEALAVHDGYLIEGFHVLPNEDVLVKTDVGIYLWDGEVLGEVATEKNGVVIPV